MKKYILLLLVLTLNCVDNTPEGICLPNIAIGLTTDLNNPSNINLQTPGGSTILNGGSKGILLFNKNGNDFVAFDKFCPSNDCTSAMTFSNRLLKCTCDESKYSVDFGGAPQTEGFECPAIEYRVTKNGSTIRISNF